MSTDEGLKDPVVVTALGVNAASLPQIFSPAYQQYVLSQTTDFVNVAGKANEAGQGAYDAQVKNDEQDVELADHEGRITANTNAIGLIEVRLTTAEGKIIIIRSDVDFLLDEVIDIQADIVDLKGRVTTAETDIDNIQSDYVSKSAVALQTIASPISVATSYSVGGVKVVGARQTGWTTSTGSALLGAFNANLSQSISTTYIQTEVQALNTNLVAARQRIKALEDALRSHGLIN